ncbi:MAG: sugar ABC transporter substrate-binding protein [Planctomycetaceae bacterium]
MIARRNILIFAVPMLLLSGCAKEQSSPASGDSSTGAASTPGQKPKIALIMKSLANEFFATMAQGAETHAAANGEQYELVANGIQDETDLAGQVTLVEQMVGQGVSAIVIAPADSKALIPALLRAKEAGIVVVNIDNRLDQAILEESKASIPFVGPDNRAGAAKIAAFLAGQLKENDQVAILEGLETSFNGQQRKLGFETALKAAKISIVDSQSAQWEMSVANQTASAMLTAHPDLKAILACNDSMALGALAAVKAAGKEGCKVVGFDNISAVQQAIRDGQILATADQHGDQLAVYGIEYALQMLKDPTTAPADRETPVDLITAKELSADEAPKK